MALETVNKIQKRLEERPLEIEKARSEGKKILGWSGYNVPEEIAYALGFIPVRIGAGGDDRLVEIGARYISTKNCVYVREVMGLFAENKDPYIKNLDVAVFDATCLQTFRLGELVEHYFNKNTIILGVPRNFYWDEAKEYFAREAEDFTKKLEEKAGTTLDLEKLKEAVELYNKTRELLIKIYDYQAANDNIIEWEETYNVIQAGYYLDKQEYLQLLEELYSELKTKQPELVIEKKYDEARIFISGSVIPPGDKKLLDIIKVSGGRIVGDDLWSGIIPYLNLDIKEITPAGVALAYLNRTPHGALPYLNLETDARLKKLHELIDKYQAKGVIYHTLRYCDPYTFKAKETKEVLGNSGTPLLEIHTEYAGSDYEAIRTRVEAFVEMIRDN